MEVAEASFTADDLVEHTGVLLAFLRNRSCPHHLAEELVQEVFIRAWQSSKNYTGGSFKSWLFGIAHNVLLHFLEKDHAQKRHDPVHGKPLSLNKILARADDEDGYERVDCIPDCRAVLPEKMAMIREELESVLCYVENLAKNGTPTERRRFDCLKDQIFYSCSLEEIARRRNISYDAARKLTKRAHTTLLANFAE